MQETLACYAGGGWFSYEQSALRSNSVDGMRPNTTFNFAGFRCAR